MPETLAAPAPSRLAPGSARGAAIGSVAVALPERVVPNASIAQRLGVDERWIVERTGILERRVADPEDPLWRLAARAGAAALARSELDPRELDLVLVATTTNDELTPNAAPIVAAELGAERAAAMDVGAACTAFVAALAHGAAHIESGRASSGLVIGADVLTRHTDPEDPQTAALFGDGAGAVVLTGADPGRIGPVILRADGAHRSAIHAPAPEGVIRMEGHDTFKHAVARLAEVTGEALEAAGLTAGEIDLFVYHQANGRIVKAVGQRLNLPADRVVECIARHGNTSAASIPIALAAAEADGRLADGARVLLAAFGAGFTWGGVVLSWGVAAPSGSDENGWVGDAT